MSMACAVSGGRKATDADVCSAAAAKLGPVWRKMRKKLPPSARSLFAELLLELRLHILPDQLLDAVGNVGRASYDIRGISELFAFLAERQSSVDLVVEPDRTCMADVISNYGGIDSRVGNGTGIYIAPPPPPPFMPELESAAMCVDLEIKMFGKCASTRIGHVCMHAPLSAVECDSSMEFILLESDIMETLDGARADPVMTHQGVPQVLFDDLLDDQWAGSHGTVTGVQPDGSISDGPVTYGLVEYTDVAAAATSSPAIGSNDEKDPYDDLPFAAVQAALRSTCPDVYGIGDIVSIGLYNSAYDLQNAMVVGIGKQRECTDDNEVHVSVRGSKFWVPARHLEMVTKKPMASHSNPSLCLVSTLEDNRAFLKRFACSLKRKMPEES